MPNSTSYTYESFIKKEADTIKGKLLDSNKIFLIEEGHYAFPEMDTNFTSSQGINKDSLSEKELNNLMEFVTVNTAISNIEMQTEISGRKVTLFLRPPGKGD